MTQGETKFKRRVLKDLKALRPKAYVLKTQERSRRGVPDLFIIWKAHAIVIELKVDGEEPTPLQAVIMKRAHDAGGIVFSTTPSGWPGHLELLRGLS